MIVMTSFFSLPILVFIQHTKIPLIGLSKIVSEYDQEIPQSQTADKPMAARGRATQPSRDTRKINQANLSLPHQDDCKTRMDIK